MAGKYGSPSLAITYDDSGGSARTVTPYIDTISGVKVEAITEQSNPFGVGNEAFTPTGMQRVPNIVMEGWYDTTGTSGPHVVFGAPETSPQASTRTFTFAPGDSKTFTVETRLISYEVIARNGQLTRFRAEVQQAGAGAWT